MLGSAPLFIWKSNEFAAMIMMPSTWLKNLGSDKVSMQIQPHFCCLVFYLILPPRRCTVGCCGDFFYEFYTIQFGAAFLKGCKFDSDSCQN